MIPAQEIDGEMWIRASDHHLAMKSAKREWVGLTAEEIWSDGSRMGLSEDGIRRFAREIEAKLKEKNT